MKTRNKNTDITGCKVTYLPPRRARGYKPETIKVGAGGHGVGGERRRKRVENAMIAKADRRNK